MCRTSYLAEVSSQDTARNPSGHQSSAVPRFCPPQDHLIADGPIPPPPNPRHGAARPPDARPSPPSALRTSGSGGVRPPPRGPEGAALPPAPPALRPCDRNLRRRRRGGGGQAPRRPGRCRCRRSRRRSRCHGRRRLGGRRPGGRPGRRRQGGRRGRRSGGGHGRLPADRYRSRPGRPPPAAPRRPGAGRHDRPGLHNAPADGDHMGSDSAGSHHDPGGE